MERYIIIPESIYSSDLAYSTILLYGLIYSLSFEKGYCEATNTTLCNCLKISSRTLQTNLKELKEHKLIDVSVYANRRTITLLDSYGKALTPLNAKKEKAIKKERMEKYLGL